jgi:hypothetical protein
VDLPDPGLSPELLEKAESQWALQEALGRLRDAVEGDPEAAAAYNETCVAMQRWLDSWSRPAADVEPD